MHNNCNKKYKMIPSKDLYAENGSQHQLSGRKMRHSIHEEQRPVRIRYDKEISVIKQYIAGVKNKTKRLCESNDMKVNDIAPNWTKLSCLFTKNMSAKKR